MTEQEALNIIVPFLYEQTCKSETEDGRYCLYRGPNNTKCAVGCLIPDSEYKSDMDCFDGPLGTYQGGIYNLLEVCPSLAGLSENFLEACQLAHDRSRANNFRASMLIEFSAVADDFDLVMPEVG